MKTLVVGGTQFIGRHVVERLLRDGHHVTLLNRGKTAPALFPELPKIIANRESEELREVQALRQPWDAVIDLCAYHPADVARLLELLRGYAGRYVQVSSLSAYVATTLDGPMPLIDEDFPLLACSANEASDRSMASYGPRKAECERAALVQRATPVVILRPSLVYGEHDHTDRMAYWLWRASRNERFLLPEDGLTVIRRTYAPDLAAACVAAAREPAAAGRVYNVADTEAPSFRDTVHYVSAHLGTKPIAVSASADRLADLGVRPWVDLPTWLPRTNLLVDTFRIRHELGFRSTPAAKALATATDAFLREARVPRAGFTPEAEAALLEKLA